MPERGETSHRVMIPEHSWLGGFATRHHPERGLVDVRLHFCCDNGSAGWTPWALGDADGEVDEVFCGARPYVMGVTVRYQRWRGLVNLRLIRAGGRGTKWALGRVGGELHWAGLAPAVRATGFELRAQPGYGLVNLRVLGRAAAPAR